ncbi:Extended synaptotagmin-2 [Tupaia chinensis]|uniref:Extended synaptotagmin-2 n=1 Tax=Tupaia chinensis TaxID=246437 RepID=L9L4Y9_TUPCH|nr:Extended synaptotagmin-2 [Tupaia chinensis]
MAEWSGEDPVARSTGELHSLALHESQVHFPDTERAEWLNKTVKHMWPFVCQFIEKLFRETIAPAVRGAHPHLSTFSFTKVDVGHQVHGAMRVILEPLIGDVPLVGALSLFFLRKPLLEINWTGLTNLLDIPGLNGLSDTVILDIIANYLVLPNRVTVPLVSEAQMAQLRFPTPKGVLRIHFIEAQDLQGKDTYLKGLVKGKSDPYGIIRVGSQIFQSSVVKESLSPKWNEVYEALVYEHPGQELEIELFDEDPDKDDFLGSLMIDLAEVEKERLLDEWFPLDEAPRGKLRLKLEWLTLVPDAARLDQVLADIRADKGQASDGLSSALLILYLDSARNLPSGKKTSSSPNPLVQMSVGHKAQESKIRYKTNEPVWEENFTFFVHNPRRQDLQVEVRDEQHQCSLGSLKVPLSQLLASDDMTMNQRFQLCDSGSNSTIKMKIALRVLHLDKQERPPDHQHSARVKRPSVSKGGRKVPVKSPVEPASPGTGGSTAPPTPVLGGGGQDGAGERAPPPEPSPLGLHDLGRSSSSLLASPSHASVKEPTPSIASDISLPIATQELRQRLRQLENGTTLGQSPLGQIQLTIRHSSQRNKLVVVVHACRNLIAFSEDGSDPYVRMYLLPDKRRSGRRKTHVSKKTLNPVFDQSFDFSVSLPEVQRRTLDVAVKNSGGFLSKDKGLLGKRDASDPFSLSELLEELSRKQKEELWQRLKALLTDVLLESPVEAWQAAGEAADTAPGSKTRKHLDIIHAVTSVLLASVSVINDSEDYEALLDCAVIVNGVLYALPESEHKLRSAIQDLCVTWWERGLPAREDMGKTAFVLLLRRSLQTRTGADICRLWRMHQALYCFDYDLEESREMRNLLLECSVSVACLRKEEVRAVLRPASRCAQAPVLPDRPSQPSGGCVCQEMGASRMVWRRSLRCKALGAGWVSAYASWVELPGAAEGLPCLVLGTNSASLFELWKSLSSAQVLTSVYQTIENDCIQDLMFHGLHLSRTSPVHPRVREMLSYFHHQKKVRQGVDEMLYRLYRPLLWRGLKARSSEVRANAALLFVDAFPIRDPSFHASEMDNEIQKQFEELYSLLEDPCPAVRSTGVLGVCKIASRYWDVMPPAILVDLLKKVTGELAWDASSADVRCAVFKCLPMVLDNKLSHPLLEQLLPTLRYSLHDNSEKVRVAFVDLLLKVKAARAAKSALWRGQCRESCPCSSGPVCLSAADAAVAFLTVDMVSLWVCFLPTRVLRDCLTFAVARGLEVGRHLPHQCGQLHRASLEVPESTVALTGLCWPPAFTVQPRPGAHPSVGSPALLSSGSVAISGPLDLTLCCRGCCTGPVTDGMTASLQQPGTQAFHISTSSCEFREWQTEFWKICPMDHILARLEIDSRPVARRLVSLIFNSFLPVNLPERAWCERCVTLLQMNPAAARRFYQHAHEHTACTNIAKLIHVIRHCLNACIRKAARECEGGDAEREPQDLSVLDQTLSVSDVASMAGLLEVVVILWKSIHRSMDSNKEARVYTIDRFAAALPEYLRVFQSVSRYAGGFRARPGLRTSAASVPGQVCVPRRPLCPARSVDPGGLLAVPGQVCARRRPLCPARSVHPDGTLTLQKSEDDRCKTPLFILMSFMPASAVPLFSCSVVSTLRGQDESATDKAYGTLLDCLCSWGHVGHVLELVDSWLPQKQPQTQSRSASKRKAQVRAVRPSKPGLALAYIEYLLTHTGNRQRLLSAPRKKLHRLLKALEVSKADLESLLQSPAGAPRTFDEATTLRAFSLFCRLSVHLQRKFCSEENVCLSDLEDTGLWLESRVLPLIRDQEEEYLEHHRTLHQQIIQTYLTVCKDVVMVGLGGPEFQMRLLQRSLGIMQTVKGFFYVSLLLGILKEVTRSFLTQKTDSEKAAALFDTVPKVFQKMLECIARSFRTQPEESLQLLCSAQTPLHEFLTTLQSRHAHSPAHRGVLSTLIAAPVVEISHQLRKASDMETLTPPERLSDLPPFSRCLMGIIMKSPNVVRSFLDELKACVTSDDIEGIVCLTAVLHIILVIHRGKQRSSEVTEVATAVYRKLKTFMEITLEEESIESLAVLCVVGDLVWAEPAPGPG